jgi:hypothetical protein
VHRCNISESGCTWLQPDSGHFGGIITVSDHGRAAETFERDKGSSLLNIVTVLHLEHFFSAQLQPVLNSGPTNFLLQRPLSSLSISPQPTGPNWSLLPRMPTTTTITTSSRATGMAGRNNRLSLSTEPRDSATPPIERGVARRIRPSRHHSGRLRETSRLQSLDSQSTSSLSIDLTGSFPLDLAPRSSGNASFGQDADVIDLTLDAEPSVLLSRAPSNRSNHEETSPQLAQNSLPAFGNASRAPRFGHGPDIIDLDDPAPSPDLAQQPSPSSPEIVFLSSRTRPHRLLPRLSTMPSPSEFVLPEHTPGLRDGVVASPDDEVLFVSSNSTAGAPRRNPRRDLPMPTSQLHPHSALSRFMASNRLVHTNTRNRTGTTGEHNRHHPSEPSSSSITWASSSLANLMPDSFRNLLDFVTPSVDYRHPAFPLDSYLNADSDDDDSSFDSFSAAGAFGGISHPRALSPIPALTPVPKGFTRTPHELNKEELQRQQRDKERQAKREKKKQMRKQREKEALDLEIVELGSEDGGSDEEEVLVERPWYTLACPNCHREISLEGDGNVFWAIKNCGHVSCTLSTLRRKLLMVVIRSTVLNAQTTASPPSGRRHQHLPTYQSRSNLVSLMDVIQRYRPRV